MEKDMKYSGYKRILDYEISSKLFIYFVFFYSFMLGTLLTIGFPSYISFIFDVLIIIGTLLLYKEKLNKILSYLFLPIILYFLISLFNIGNVNVLSYFWGIRNLYRFYLCFVIVALSFNSKDLKIIINSLFWLTIINFLLVIIQFAFLGVRQDYLNGIFGTTLGLNGSVNVLCISTIIMFLNLYLQNRVGIFKTIFMIVLSIVPIVLAEIKFALIEFIIIFVLSLIINKKSKKTFIIFVFSTLILFLGIFFISSVYSYEYKFFSKDFFNYYFTRANRGYNAVGDVNRTTFVSVINNLLQSDFKHQIFGYGQGFAEVSSISSLNSSFSQMYADTTHYNWFLSAFMYIEVGWLGIILYCLFFVSVMVFCVIHRKQNPIYCIGICLSVFGILQFFYNFSLRMDGSGHLFYILLGMPIAYYLNGQLDVEKRENGLVLQ